MDPKQNETVSLAAYAGNVARHAKVVWIEDVPWRVEGPVLSPLAMPHTMKPVNREELRQTMHDTKTLLAAWNDAWNVAECDWWWVCADAADYDMAQFKKNARYDIRQGLKNCTVRRVEASWLAENGYAVYAAAFSRYGTEPNLKTSKKFADEVLWAGGYSGRENWGAFIGDQLVSFASCIVIDNAVLFSWAKADPEQLKHFPNNALYYELTRHYLCDRKFQYVADGARVIRHETRMQDFLEKMGYRRIYCPLRVEASPLLQAVVRSGVHRWGRWLGVVKQLRGKLDNLGQVAKLLKIANSCKNIPAGDGKQVQL